jgi:hypothetical protein
MPQYSFWPQELVNGTWSATAPNIIHILKMAPNLPKPIKKWISKKGSDFLTLIKGISKAFHIPADNDDSGVNLALLGLLK